MKTQTVKASEVREGHTITSITTPGWREDIQPADGRRPTVINAVYRENGEGGAPTVYIATSDDPRSEYCLGPDDQVTVEVSS